MQDVARAQEVLGEILRLMGLSVVLSVEDGPERTVIDIKGPESGLVIGKKGQTLEALQYLVGKIIHRGAEAAPHGKPLVIDSEGYRTRRESSLVDLAHRLAEKAVRTQRTITVNPMSPHDRRIIHITLDQVAGVTTHSEGEGVFRRLLIVPAPDKKIPTAP